MESKLKKYGYGRVVKDKPEDDWYIEVLITEQVTDVSGDPKEKKKINNTVTDKDGNISSNVLSSGGTITARWLNFNGSNRVTPPNVMTGETVMIYNYSGTDEYFWVDYETEPDLRKREKAIYFWSNKGSKDDSWVSKGYYALVDTINKAVKFFTSANDGELTTYNIQIDTKVGILVVEDGKGNLIKLKSGEDTWDITSNNNINITSTNTVNIKTTNCNVEASGSFVVKSGVTRIN